MNSEQREEVRARLLSGGKGLKLRVLTRYFERRRVDPFVQWQWEALTVVRPDDRVIEFPNGVTQRY